MLVELSFALNYFIPIAVIEPILNKIIFNTLTILIGLTILISSVLIFTSKPQLITINKKSKKKKKKKKGKETLIYQINSEGLLVHFKKNIFFSLITFIILIGLILVKEIQIPNLKWQLNQQPLFLKFLFNALLIFGTILIFWCIIDFVKLIFNYRYSARPLNSKKEN
jgi:hypothetical protein